MNPFCCVASTPALCDDSLHKIKPVSFDAAYQEVVTTQRVGTSKDSRINSNTLKCFLIFIHCSVPRIKTSDGNVVLVKVPWARQVSVFTLLFEVITMSLIEKEMPVNKIDKLLGEHPNRLWRIFNYWVKRSYILNFQ